MDDNIANFTSITGADPQRAAQYLQLTDNNLEQAIQLFFDSPNLDLSGDAAHHSSSAAGAHADEPINIDSDDDDDVVATPAAPAAAGHNVEDDEAMARRLQEEMYSAGGRDANSEVRAPMARTTETLVGPGGGYDEDDMHTAIMAQMAARRRAPGESLVGMPRRMPQRMASYEDSRRIGPIDQFGDAYMTPGATRAGGLVLSLVSTFKLLTGV